MHVRGFTRNDKIPYLQELGVTAVELMPVHQFDPKEGNYWGYNDALIFFSPPSIRDSTRFAGRYAGISKHGRRSAFSWHRSVPGRGIQPHNRSRLRRSDVLLPAESTMAHTTY